MVPLAECRLRPLPRTLSILAALLGAGIVGLGLQRSAEARKGAHLASDDNERREGQPAAASQ